MKGGIVRHLPFFVAVLHAALAALSCQAAQDEPSPTVIAIGEDFVTYREGGRTADTSDQITVIGNAIHYLEAGVWKASENVIELNPESGGAVARRGPHTATFAPTLGEDAVFTVRMSDGRQFSGAPRAVQVSGIDGRTVTVATVRNGTEGKLVPPNAILYENAFEGLAADLLLIWRHDQFAHDLVLRETPKLPAGWDPASTRIEVLTEFWSDAAVEVRQQAIDETPVIAEFDDVQVRFGPMSLEVGEAFPVQGAEAWALGAGFARDGAIPVRKRWKVLALDNYVLFESIPFRSVADTLGMRQASKGSGSPRREADPQASDATSLHGGVGLLSADGMRSTPLSVAVVGKTPPSAGYLIDFTIVPANQITNFAGGETYYIQSNYTISATATFGTNAVLKFKNGTYLRVSGLVNFPASGPQVIFTSRDDDLFGTKVTSLLVTNATESTSDGNPTDHRASFALHLYYHSVGLTVRNARFRWAQTAIKYDNSIGNVNGVDNCVFEHSDYGIHALYIPSSHPVNVSNSRHCNVTTPTYGYVNGTIVTDAGVINASNWTNNQAEPAIAARLYPGTEPNNTKVVIVALSRTNSSGAEDIGMVRMISADGGKTWPTVGHIATGSGSDIPKANGDADPSMAYDQYNNLFLTYRGPGGTNAVLAISTDDGTNWTKVSGFNGTNFGGATPRVAIGPTNGSGIASLWVSMQTNGHRSALSCVGTSIRGAGTNNVGGATNWTSVAHLPGATNVVFHSVAVGPTGQVAVVYTRGTGSPIEVGPIRYVTLTDPDGLGPGGFSVQAGATFTNLFGQTLLPAHGLEVDPVPVLSWHWSSNVLFLTYTGRTNTTDDTDSDVLVRTSTNGGQSWSSETKAHSDSSKSQFHPWIGIDQQSGNAAIVWYDARDNATNSQAHIYGSVSRGRYVATPQSFRMTPTPANPNSLASTLKEYIGCTYVGGSVYPAWLNHRSTNDLTWDIYSVRLPF